MYSPLPRFLTIKTSHIHGLGLFFTKDLLSCSMVGQSHMMVGREIIRLPLGGFYNHSDTPNCIKIRLGNGYYLETIKDVLAGEELTVKYTLYDPT